MPYSDTHKIDGTPRTQDDCTGTWQSGVWTELTVCDANSSISIASLFEAGDLGNLQQTKDNRAHGRDNTSTIAECGAVASWIDGDFNYDVGEALGGTDVQTNADGKYKFQSQTAQDMMDYEIDSAAAGLFNIPVCRIFDTRSYPSSSGHYSARGCTLRKSWTTLVFA